MAILKEIEKHPAEIRRIPFSWRKDLADGRTISSHVVTVPAGLTLVSSSIVAVTNIVAYISGGTHGQTYNVECKVTLSDSEVLVGEINIKVRDYS